jgi:hypothetical protein
MQHSGRTTYALNCIGTTGFKKSRSNYRGGSSSTMKGADAVKAPARTKGDLVPPTRIERATRGLGNRCSIQLSYGGVA